MKLSLYVLAALAAVATAAPAPAEQDIGTLISEVTKADAAHALTQPPNPAALDDASLDPLAAIDAAFNYFPTRDDTTHTLVERGWDLKTCLAGCASVSKMEKVCRLIPLPPVRAGCWGISVALSTPWGKTMCKNWCHGVF